VFKTLPCFCGVQRKSGGSFLETPSARRNIYGINSVSINVQEVLMGLRIKHNDGIEEFDARTLCSQSAV
jgi:hypothetical protein